MIWMICIIFIEVRELNALIAAIRTPLVAAATRLCSGGCNEN
jgi:hypothetical protein